MLRGGSFGTDPAACRGTFRNWDYPIRRQIFSGFRCARDARPEEALSVCRHLAYLGPPVPLRGLLFDAAALAGAPVLGPADMRGGGTINADGFGVGWYRATRPTRSGTGAHRPIWTDPDLPALAGAGRGRRGARRRARRATVGMPVDRAGGRAVPDGRWLFSHNGVVGRLAATASARARRPGCPSATC